ncbi:SPFH domain-containing protein [Prevotella sp. Rep29]|uniref:SPFH domain-containing protein n=1 Tax=Prevotella sp. Rep29 TaxID=2691580 RepID=UPI001C6F22D2|nr:SPFH domain-containing protein [Prevotella sp. Rep29]QYR10103.1 SPFH domain-containing protein [Prevotella sp. Rep29]
METKEFAFKGLTINGFLMLCINLILTLGGITLIVLSIINENLLFIPGGIILILSLFLWGGLIKLEPNETLVMVFFGKYKGTLTRTGFFWVNPFLTTKKLSLRSRNLDIDPIKVNDKTGNPIMIGVMLVWKLKDTYRAMFEIDSQTIAKTDNPATVGTNVSGVMRAFEHFVRIQSDAALRQVAGQYAYDDTDNSHQEITLRSGGDEINEELEAKLDERLAMAGIEIVEARINYLAYAPEIAAVMLRRQQASAIITAREKIVEGAVSMVKMALDKLSNEEIVELDDDKKAAMVSNLLVVLCGDDTAQPVVNTGTLNH